MRQNQQPDLGAWSRVEPPASLDALVRARAVSVLELRRAEAPPLTPAHSVLPARCTAPARSLGLVAQGLVYSRAIVSYAAQVMDGAARLFRRGVTG